MAELKATPRSDVGTRKSRKLRAQGAIPGIIYGHGEPPEAVTLSRHDVELVVHHGERLLEVDLEGRKQNVLVKEVQYDALGQVILHMDLTRVDLDERVEVTVPIILRGTPVGVSENGVLQQYIAQVQIECAVRAIPDDVRVSVAEMKVGNMLAMRDLPLPEGAKLVSDPELVVASVRVIAEEAVPAAAEPGPAEPEVIGEKKEEEAEGEEAAAEKKPPKIEKKEKE
jgi:large subunit ribosomal protein L25